MTTIYVLKCRNNKYYVGNTKKTAMKRYKEHAAGNGCAWTRKYKPIELVECTLGDKFDEDKITKGKEVQQFYKNLILLKKFLDINKRRPKKDGNAPDEEKRLGRWLGNSLSSCIKNNTGVMKNKKVKQKWNEFNNKYNKYYMSKKQIWFITFDKYKKLFDENDRKPASSAKNETEKRLGQWGNRQNLNYKKNKETKTQKTTDEYTLSLLDPDIRKKWCDFINVPKYGNSFKTTEELWFIRLKEAEDYLDKNDTGMPPANTRVGQWIRSQERNYKKKIASMKNPKIKKAWESFYKKYKSILEKWCGFPNQEERNKYINLSFEEWCEKGRVDLILKYNDETLKYETLTYYQQVYLRENNRKMTEVYTYFNMLRLMKSDYSISLKELCNIHIKPVLHLIGDTIYDEDFSKVRTIGVQKWLTKHRKGINDIRIFLELPLTKKAHIAYDYWIKRKVYDSQWETKMADLLFINLHPDYDYIIHQRYPKSFYDFIERDNRAWSFHMDFTIIEKKTTKNVCNIEVWQNSMEEVNKCKTKDSKFYKRMYNYCNKQGGRNHKEKYWKTHQSIPFIGIEGCYTVTKKGQENILNQLRKIVPLEKRELSKEFLDNWREEVKKIRKVGNYYAFANPENHYVKKYTEEERKEFEDELKLMMEKNGGELPEFNTFAKDKSCLGSSFAHIIRNTNLYTKGFTEVCDRIGDKRENTKKKRSEHNRDINVLRCRGLKPDSTEDDIKNVFCNEFINFLNTIKNGDYYTQKQWGEYSDKLPNGTFGKASEGRVYKQKLGNQKNPWGKKTKGRHDWFAKFRKDSIEWATKKKINFPNVTFQKGNNDYQQHKEKEAKFIKLVAEKKKMLSSPQTILRHLKKKKLENPNLELTNEEKEEKVLMTWFKNCYEWLKGSRQTSAPQYVNETFKKFKDIPIIKDHKYVKNG